MKHKIIVNVSLCSILGDRQAYSHYILCCCSECAIAAVRDIHFVTFTLKWTLTALVGANPFAINNNNTRTVELSKENVAQKKETEEIA